MATQSSALADINERNRRFWLEQSQLLNSRIQNTTLCEVAMDDLSWEQVTIPVKNRRSFEQILAHAEKSRTIFQRAFSQNGGKAPKGDALKRWIVEIVRGEPNINTRQLGFKIRSLANSGDSIFNRVDRKPDDSLVQNEQIHFDDDGKDKTARISGLKDRLSRAKKEIVSR